MYVCMRRRAALSLGYCGDSGYVNLPMYVCVWPGIRLDFVIAEWPYASDRMSLPRLSFL